MITQVEIHNFQSHKHSVLEFIPGTNVIIGLSDSGKSAIFRAINWVLTNRPLGDAFRSDWGGDTHVILHLDDGNVVERIRSSSRNEYRLNGEVLKAFGVDPPEPVLAVLRMDPANVQSQQDPPFLLALSPGEAARMLNKAASLQEIDGTISNLKKSQLETQRRLDFQEQQRKELEECLADFDDLDELEAKVERLEELQKDYDNQKARQNHLEALIGRIERLEDRLGRTENVPELLKKCEALLVLHKEYKETSAKVYRIISLGKRIAQIERGLERTKDVGTLIERHTKICSLYEQYQAVAVTRRNLQQLLSRIKNVTTSVQQTEKAIQEKEEKFHSLAPDVCPLCGGAMK